MNLVPLSESWCIMYVQWQDDKNVKTEQATVDEKRKLACNPNRPHIKRHRFLYGMIHTLFCLHILDCVHSLYGAMPMCKTHETSQEKDGGSGIIKEKIKLATTIRASFNLWYTKKSIH